MDTGEAGACELISACVGISSRVCRHPTAACVLTAHDLSAYCCLGTTGSCVQVRIVRRHRGHGQRRPSALPDMRAPHFVQDPSQEGRAVRGTMTSVDAQNVVEHGASGAK
jgi:hypothetical protein